MREKSKSFLEGQKRGNALVFPWYVSKKKIIKQQWVDPNLGKWLETDGGPEMSWVFIVLRSKEKKKPLKKLVIKLFFSAAS